MSLYSNHFQQPTIFYASITTPVPYDIYLEKNKQHTSLLLRFSNNPAEDLHIELGQIYWLETSSIRSTLMDIFNPSIWESIRYAQPEHPLWRNFVEDLWASPIGQWCQSTLWTLTTDELSWNALYSVHPNDDLLLSSIQIVLERAKALIDLVGTPIQKNSWVIKELHLPSLLHASGLSFEQWQDFQAVNGLLKNHYHKDSDVV